MQKLLLLASVVLFVNLSSLSRSVNQWLISAIVNFNITICLVAWVYLSLQQTKSDVINTQEMGP